MDFKENDFKFMYVRILNIENNLKIENKNNGLIILLNNCYDIIECLNNNYDYNLKLEFNININYIENVTNLLKDILLNNCTNHKLINECKNYYKKCCYIF